VDPKVLLCVTDGLAYGEVKTSETFGVVPTAFSNTSTNVGWAVGAGIDGARRWECVDGYRANFRVSHRTIGRLR
jgi:hypothetical protein